MSTQTYSADQFLMGGGAKSAKFDKPGDKITGTIIEPPEVRQQTDIATGEPVFWPSGDPKMQLVVTLQTTLRDDPDDDGIRRWFIKGKSMTDAVREAVKSVGARGLEVGGIPTCIYTHDGTASQRGFNPPKLYAAEYIRPDSAAASGAFLGVTPQNVQVAPAAAQPTPEQIAALKAINVDPKLVYPHYTG